MKKRFNTRRYGKRKWQKRKDRWMKKLKKFNRPDLMSSVSHHALIPQK